MKTLFLLLLFCHVSSAVKHSLKFLYTVSSGVQNLPEFMVVTLIDDTHAGSYDSNGIIEVYQDVWKKIFSDKPEILELYTQLCFEILPSAFKSTLDKIMQRFNHSGGVHILQLIERCELDEKTGKTVFVRGGYDGENFMSLDVKMRTWVALKPEADIIKQEWDTDKARMEQYFHYVTEMYPEWLRICLNYGKSFLLRTVPPSVSLLQKSPSSPVSCHATGFYPDRATMFWRKDGEKLYEDVDHGEILPNHDGTFQMTVDLNISSVKPEDWRRYDCVFQLSGVEDIVTKLDKAVIRTNLIPPSEFPVGAVIGVVVGLILLSVCITGLFIWRKQNNGFRPANTSDS